MQFSAKVTFDCPIRQVFDYAAGLAFWPQWLSTIASAEWAATGPLDIGAVIYEANRRFDSSDVVAWEVTQYEPPHVFAFRTISDPQVTICQVFESLGCSTSLTLSTAGEAAELFTAQFQLQLPVAVQLAHDLERLKALLMDPAHTRRVSRHARRCWG